MKGLHLAASDLGHAFGTRVLFRRLAFRVTPEAPLAITGANGAGKSTLVQVLAGLLTPRKGRVELVLEGRAVPEAQRPFACGLVAPYLQVYEGLTVRENLAFVAHARRLDRLDARTADVLALVGLTARADDLVSTFSSGLKQRVRYAAALLPDPPVLLLDEPTANLDAAGFEMVARVRTRQAERGGLLVVATNDPDEAAWCAQEVRVGG